MERFQVRAWGFAGFSFLRGVRARTSCLSGMGRCCISRMARKRAKRPVSLHRPRASCKTKSADTFKNSAYCPMCGCNFGRHVDLGWPLFMRGLGLLILILPEVVTIREGTRRPLPGNNHAAQMRKRASQIACGCHQTGPADVISCGCCARHLNHRNKIYCSRQ